MTFQPFKIKELAPILVMMSWIIAKYAGLIVWHGRRRVKHDTLKDQ